jgi:L-rhamnose mutarotase
MKTRLFFLNALILMAVTAACGGLANADATTPKRYAWITGLNPDKAAWYEYLHAHAWPGVTTINKACHIQNFSINEIKIGDKIYLFAHLEYTGTDFDADMKKMAADPTVQRCWKETDPCQIPLPAAAAKGKIWTDMKEVYFMP